MLATYDYYTTIYLGSKINNAETFSKYEKQAEVYINLYTFDKTKDISNIRDEVKECACELVDYLYNVDELTNLSSGIVSESTDGHSVSYEKISNQQLNMTVKKIIKKHLLQTGLLYPC